MEREEALEVVRKNMPTDRSLPVYEALQTLIPELAESEDEKIINAIIGVLKCSDAIDVNVSHKKMFAYLEKQKGQMLKDVFVDNYVVHDGRIELEGDPLPSLDPILLLPYPQFKPGDKVKVIVHKAEED